MTQHPEEGTLHAYIDGELSPTEVAALELHVGECARCAAALAEARGFVAAASRVITTLDAAPASAARPAVPAADVAAAVPRRVVRPPIFRVPYARAAALLLLVGGTAFVVDRTGTLARGRSSQVESLQVDAAAETDLAPVAPAGVAGTTPTPAIAAPQTDVSTGAGIAAVGNVRREPVARRRAATGAVADGTTPARAAERSAPPSATGQTAGDQSSVAAKNPEPVMAQASLLAGKEAAPEAAKSTAHPAAPPPPAAADVRLEQIVVTSALSFVPTVVRYRTKEGIVVTLVEEPLRTSFAEESVATRQSAPTPLQRRAAAPMAATPINSYRWSIAQRGKIYTLSGPLTVAELEALSKRLNALERLP